MVSEGSRIGLPSAGAELTQSAPICRVNCRRSSRAVRGVAALFTDSRNFSCSNRLLRRFRFLHSVMRAGEPCHQSSMLTNRLSIAPLLYSVSRLILVQTPNLRHRDLVARLPLGEQISFSSLPTQQNRGCNPSKAMQSELGTIKELRCCTECVSTFLGNCCSSGYLMQKT